MPILESTLEPLTRTLVVTKSLEDLLDEHLTPTEKEKISGLISDKLISPDSSADVADLSDRDSLPDLAKDDELIDYQPVEAKIQVPKARIKHVCDPDDCLPDLPEGVIIKDEEDCDLIEIEELVVQVQELALDEDLHPNQFNKEAELSDTEGSSDSPDTVVCDSPQDGPSTPEEIDMTNSKCSQIMSCRVIGCLTLAIPL